MTENGGLQFDAAEPTGSAEPLKCGQCGTSLDTVYHAINDKVVCEGCRRAAEQLVALSGAPSTLARALWRGLGAAVIGAAIYYAILAATGYEVGLVAILVGYLVGRAVNKGSRGIGGLRYQILAVALTYCAIVSTYVPLIIRAAREQAVTQAAPADSLAAAGGDATAPAGADTGSTPVAADAKPGAPADTSTVSFAQFAGALGTLVLFILAVPFLAGLQNIIGILIIGFGLFEAWRVNRRVKLAFSGPHQVSARA
jgi:hypothetical protein